MQNSLQFIPVHELFHHICHATSRIEQLHNIYTALMQVCHLSNHHTLSTNANSDCKLSQFLCSLRHQNFRCNRYFPSASAVKSRKNKHNLVQGWGILFLSMFSDVLFSTYYLKLFIFLSYLSACSVHKLHCSSPGSATDVPLLGWKQTGTAHPQWQEGHLTLFQQNLQLSHNCGIQL